MKQKILDYIKTWESKGYSNGIPDAAPLRLEQLNKVPSYRKICIAILKNDVCLTSLGFSKPKCELYSELKRIEIEQRNERT
ncbi:MAG: DUF3440 domain-containing protein [Turicibacter sp.]